MNNNPHASHFSPFCPDYLTDQHLGQFVRHCLEEDAYQQDVSAAFIPETEQASASIMSREHGILCGMVCLPFFLEAFPQVSVTFAEKDGAFLNENVIFLQLSGPARDLLTLERSLLNILQTLSGTATITTTYVKALSGTGTRLLDTRKTIPLLRNLQKYAVLIGGGLNHRLHLRERILLKENHLQFFDSISAAITQAKQQHPNIPLEVEVENITQLHEALSCQPDYIMLDNFSINDVIAAAQLPKGNSAIEVSGNITLETLHEYARPGIDYISVGSLTKHVRAIDMSMRML